MFVRKEREPNLRGDRLIRCWRWRPWVSYESAGSENGFSILCPLRFIGDFDHLPYGIRPGGRVTMFCGSNSLLRRKDSLFLQNNSLFC